MTEVDIELHVNGEAHRCTVAPRRLLTDVLREDLHLTGTRTGCEHGSCGTCTVLLDGQPARACLVFAVQLADGTSIETVESLGGEEDLHRLQQAFLDHHALQCGFCTSGFLMVGAELLRRDPPPDDAALRDAISSNLCRCTGYTPIAQAVRACIGTPVEG